MAHTIDCVCSKMLNHGLNHMGYFFQFSSLYPALYIELYMCYVVYSNLIIEFQMNFKAVLALPKTAHSAHSIFILSLVTPLNLR